MFGWEILVNSQIIAKLTNFSSAKALHFTGATYVKCLQICTYVRMHVCTYQIDILMR